MSVLDAAYNVAHDHPGGLASLAPRLGKKADVLGAELRASGSAKFALLEAVKVTQLTGDLRILHTFAEECGQMCVPLPDLISADQDDVLRALGEASVEFGSMCHEVCDGMRDGDISDNELARIERERTDLIAKLHQLGEAIRARNLASKPKHVLAELRGGR